MINGIDLLFVLMGFILLFLVVEIWDRYRNWYEWDCDRRYRRKMRRYEIQDMIAESEYRVHLKTLLSPGFIAAIHRMNRSFEKFNQALRGEQL